MYLKRTVNPNSVPIYMTGIKHFFVMNRVRIYWEIIQKMYPEQVKEGDRDRWLKTPLGKEFAYGYNIKYLQSTLGNL